MISSKLSQSLHLMEELEEDEVLVSFQLKTLFPTVPVKKLIAVVLDRLYQQQNDPQWKFKVKQYIRLVGSCVEGNYFPFKGEYCKQLKGALMCDPPEDNNVLCASNRYDRDRQPSR